MELLLVTLRTSFTKFFLPSESSELFFKYLYNLLPNTNQPIVITCIYIMSQCVNRLTKQYDCTIAIIMYEIGATILVVESAAGTGMAMMSTINIKAMTYI
jgi:hypothetical protein